MVLTEEYNFLGFFMDNLLGSTLYEEIKKNVSFHSVLEIRLRANRPVLVKTLTRAFFLSFIPTPDYLREIIIRATGNSLYAHEREISDGYLEYKDGVRIGIGGTGRINDKNIAAYSVYNSLCIRIPHGVTPNNNLKDLLSFFENTLILGPPFSGKTTLIRYFANELAESHDVVVIDERKEIFGSALIYATGKRLDIVQGISKQFVFEKIIRSMSPEIVVCDELFGEKDYQAIREIVRSGIRCLASFHSTSKKEIPSTMSDQFTRFITLSSNPTPGSILSIEK